MFFILLYFSGLKRLTGVTYVERAVLKAIKNDIAIYAIHTALDNVAHGVNYGMAKALKLKKTSILIPKQNFIYKLVTYVPHNAANIVKEALFNAGAGQIGNYDECSFTTSGEGTFRANKKANPVLGQIGKQHQEEEIQINITFEKHLESKILNALFTSHPYEEVAYEVTSLQNKHQHIGMGMIGELENPLTEKEFLKFIKKTFKTGGVRHSELLNTSIKRVAVLGGSGAFGINNAIRAGADAYVTADLKYHDYYKAEKQILLADIGHFESERFTKSIIAGYLTEKIRNFGSHFIRRKYQSHQLYISMAKKKEITVEEKLRALYDLQLIDSRVDQIRNVRGELPLEVEDLEDEVAGLNKRIEKLDNELSLIEDQIKAKKIQIEDSKASIKKYSEQQKNVRNNREFNALSKEVEFQELEIQLAEKNIREFKAQIEQKNEVIDKTKERLGERDKHLKHKKSELDAILAETEKEEKALIKKSEDFEKEIDERLVQAYKRIRTNVRNGLAVVAIERGASGGSFFTIPPQVQVEIAGRKKVITDEHSGRILVDSELATEEKEKMEKLFKSI